MSLSGIMTALVFNPGSASLKFELIETDPAHATASDARKLVSASIEEIGSEARLLVFHGRQIAHQEDCEAADMAAGARHALTWLRKGDFSHRLRQLTFIGVRVVHGGDRYAAPVRCTPEVLKDIEALAELAPLHNKNSLAILSVLAEQFPGVPTLAAFDTAFHRSLPEIAWRYPVDRGLADRFGIRKYGFHGLSHRYMLEHYAQMIGKSPNHVSVVTLHLESGCSACAIARGRSVDTTMGLTPLEGLMMGTRSGSVDPAIVPYLMRKLNVGADEVMTILNRKSGLLGIAGETFDTRELVKREDPAARLALRMFSYRVSLAVGAFLAVLDGAEAVLFGGGIGEDTPPIREQACLPLRGLGLELDQEANQRATAGCARISRIDSRLQAFVIPVEEGLEIAHECAQTLSQ